MTKAELQKLVRQGEGARLEFKQKVGDPEKILKEIVAFLNTRGGQLLIGVSDDGILSGLKDPQEAMEVLKNGIENQIRPSLRLHPEIIVLNQKRSVLLYNIREGKKKPYFLNPADRERGQVYVRFEDQSIQASKELVSIIRRRRKTRNGFLIQYTENHKRVLKHLNQEKGMTIAAIEQAVQLPHAITGKVLEDLVLGNIVELKPDEKGDTYLQKNNTNNQLRAEHFQLEKL